MTRRITIIFCLLFAVALCLGAAMNMEKFQNSSQKEWNQPNATAAFSLALTRSAYDRVFRDRLTASPESAKKAVSEIGHIAVPKKVVILFHEDKYNENYHIFDLPPFDENAEKTHGYGQYFQCCYLPW